MSSKIYISSIIRLENISKQHADDANVQKAAKRLTVNLLKSWLNKEQPRKQKLKHGLNAAEWECLKNKQKIPAIRLVRERTNMGLAETKNFVEKAMQAEYGFTHFPYVETPSPYPYTPQTNENW